MEHLATPHINGANATALRDLYNQKLQASLLSLLSSAAKGLKKNFEELNALVNDLPVSGRLHPAIYSANHQLAATMRSGSRSKVEESLVSLEGVLKRPPEPGIQIGTVYEHEYQFGMIEKLSTDSVLGGEVLALSPNELETEAGHCRAAMKLIADHAPGMNEEMQALLSRVSLFKGTRKGYGVIGASDVQVFGEVFLRGNLYDMDPRAYYCEHLVHETSHYDLHALMEFDRIVQNDPSELYPAPIRQDPRPMFGIYHATFVLSRMVWVFDKIIQATHDPAFAEALEVFQDQFRKGFRVLNDHGKFSPLGWKIVDGYKSMLGELVQ